MDVAVVWYLVLGVILMLMALSSSYFGKLPVTTSIIYFLFGILIGPYGLYIVEADLIRDAAFFERVTEIVVLISLFVAGLKLRLPFNRLFWSPTLRLATISMAVTVGLITVFGYYFLKLPIGVSVLIGAILAPTDPVLASGVQVKHPEDRDKLRFSLTGEAGLNDGTAFPFVMLGLALMGLHEIGDSGIKWFVKDGLWATFAGLAVGWALGHLVSRLVIYLRKKNEETVILDDFLAIGLIALSYGCAHIIGSYGFLAVFAAGLSMRKIGKETKEEGLPSSVSENATMAKGVRSFTEQLERVGEVVSVVLLGTMFQMKFFETWDLLIIPALFLLIRPISVFVGLVGMPMGTLRRPLIAWFGIRGIGSIYYLTYAFTHGFSGELAQRVAIIVYCTVVASIFIHGISGLPIMNLYKKRVEQT